MVDFRQRVAAPFPLRSADSKDMLRCAPSHALSMILTKAVEPQTYRGMEKPEKQGFAMPVSTRPSGEPQKEFNPDYPLGRRSGFSPTVGLKPDLQPVDLSRTDVPMDFLG